MNQFSTILFCEFFNLNKIVINNIYLSLKVEMHFSRLIPEMQNRKPKSVLNSSSFYHAFRKLTGLNNFLKISCLHIHKYIHRTILFFSTLQICRFYTRTRVYTSFLSNNIKTNVFTPSYEMFNPFHNFYSLFSPLFRIRYFHQRHVLTI